MPEEKDELRTLLLELTPEQMQEFYDFGKECRQLLDELKLDFVKSLVSGRGSRNTIVQNLQYRIGSRNLG